MTEAQRTELEALATDLRIMEQEARAAKLPQGFAMMFGGWATRIEELLQDE